VTPRELATTLAKDVICTFSCARILFVLGMVPRNYKSEAVAPAALAAAAEALEDSLAREVQIIDGEILVELDDPVEAIVAARDHDLYLQRCIASGTALLLLREPGAPAQETWDWLCSRLSITTDAPHADGIVKLGIGRTSLPSSVERMPERAGVLLWILQGSGDDRLIFVDSPITIGRSAPGSTAGIELDDRIMSRQHCAITRPDRGWSIEDSGSISGTFVEGGRLVSRRLVPGMLIRAGASLLVVLAVRN
jgi:hypothetical protein